MAEEEPINEVELELSTGEVTYKGVVYTFDELLDEWNSEDDDKQDRAAELRDPKSDIQNLWGNKRNNFRDNWKRRIKPLKKRKGYPRDLG